MQKGIKQVQRLILGCLARAEYQADLETLDFLKELEAGLSEVSNSPPPSNPSAKPPRWSKPKDKTREAVIIQKHIRGFLQRKAYRAVLIERMYEENEQMFQEQLKEVEEGFNSSRSLADRENAVPSLGDLSHIKSFNMPRPLTSNRLGMFSPSKNKNLTAQVQYDYDIYIVAAREIQRVWRGFRARQKLGGSLRQIRKKVLLIQHAYKDWRQMKTGQVEIALHLISKQTEMLVRTFTSYQQLRSLVLIKDPAGSNSRFLNSCEDKLQRAGVYQTSDETERLLRILSEERAQHKLEQQALRRKAQHWKDQFKRTLNNYLKGIKGLKSQIELSQKSSFECVSSIVLDLARAKAEIRGNR